MFGFVYSFLHFNLTLETFLYKVHNFCPMRFKSIMICKRWYMTIRLRKITDYNLEHLFPNQSCAIRQEVSSRTAPTAPGTMSAPTGKPRERPAAAASCSIPPGENVGTSITLGAAKYPRGGVPRMGTSGVDSPQIPLVSIWSEFPCALHFV